VARGERPAESPYFVNGQGLRVDPGAATLYAAFC
jgi:hypothetical protein